MTIQATTAAPSDPAAKTVATAVQTVTTSGGAPVTVSILEGVESLRASIRAEYPSVAFAAALDQLWLWLKEEKAKREAGKVS